MFNRLQVIVLTNKHTNTHTNKLTLTLILFYTFLLYTTAVFILLIQLLLLHEKTIIY